MAFAMIGGIFAATFLTLLFLPALYVGWYGIHEVQSAKPQPSIATAESGARAPTRIDPEPARDKPHV
jgi:hypothetical protein